MDSVILKSIANKLKLDFADDEPEEYILTAEEEAEALSHAKKVAVEKMVYKLKSIEKVYGEAAIEQKLSEVNWDEHINKDEVLKICNSNKQQIIWHQQNREQQENERVKYQKRLQSRCDAKYMFREMKWVSKNVFKKDLIVHDDNKLMITALCYFLSNDPRFETDLGFSFKKGLMIRGRSGLGKTHLVRCLEDNELNPIKVFSMLEIESEIKKEGDFLLSPGEKKLIYLDDVGTEEAVVNHYGTKVNWFKTFIEDFYLHSSGFNKIIISTNSSAEEIEQKYGFRVRSRIREMFNAIDVKGKDMRN